LFLHHKAASGTYRHEDEQEYERGASAIGMKERAEDRSDQRCELGF
jgi:hypothetical protein